MPLPPMRQRPAEVGFTVASPVWALRPPPRAVTSKTASGGTIQGAAVRVLLTGHLGYLGARLTPMLRSAGIEVVGFDNGMFRDCAIGPLDAVPAIDKDIRDVEARDVRGFDAVIHLAGLSSEELGHIHPALTFEVNFEASLRLAQLAKQEGARRFLFASSVEVYGPGSARRGEGAPLAPESPYAVSKALAEEELGRLADDGFAPVFLRAAQPYGMSPMLRFEPMLNRMVAQAASDGRILACADDGPRLDLVHVEDLSRAYIAALRAPEHVVRGQAFNVGAPGESYGPAELALVVRETVPGAEIEVRLEEDTRSGRGPAKFGKIACMLPDFRPRWTARRGAVEVYQALARLALTRADIEGARYGRAHHLRMIVRLGRMDEELRLVKPADLGGVCQAV